MRRKVPPFYKKLKAMSAYELAQRYATACVRAALADVQGRQVHPHTAARDGLIETELLLRAGENR